MRLDHIGASKNRPRYAHNRSPSRSTFVSTTPGAAPLGDTQYGRNQTEKPVPARARLMPETMTPLAISPALATQKSFGRHPPPIPKSRPDVPTKLNTLKNLETLTMLFSFSIELKGDYFASIFWTTTFRADST